MTRKLLSFILTLAMVITLVPSSTIKANAAVSQTDINKVGNTMELTWNAVSGAGSYEIQRAGSRLGTYTTIGTTTATRYTDTTPNANQYENYYKVLAKSGSNTLNTYIISLESKIFGNNMKFYDAKYDSMTAITDEVTSIHDNEMFNAQFSDKRYALYFKPGDYRSTMSLPVGYYTHIGGLGKTPLDTKLAGVRTPASLPDNNATCTFWRSIENAQLNQMNGDMYYGFMWSVSQAAPARRLDVNAATQFDWYWGWASGGYAADSVFHQKVGSYSQQQWYTRNSDIQDAAGIYGVNWNNFAQGCTGTVTATDWSVNDGAHTKVDTTPVIREKPFLYLDGDTYKVFVPSLRQNAVGVSWSSGNMGSGTSLNLLNDFYVAKADVDTAATINAQLKNGKNIFFTPGNYVLEAPLYVGRTNAVLLGTGLATLIPAQSNVLGAVFVDDVDGVTVAGLLFDAHYSSEYLLRVGETTASGDHSANPTLLADLFFRIGGFQTSDVHVDVAVQINSNNVIGDHFWVWRADHGNGVGWTHNTSPNGLIVKGNNVTFYALMVEHFQEYQTLWTGENGRTYFYQCETPYDPTNQAAYMSHNNTVKGWSAYKVANTVNNHLAMGLGIYDVFINTGADRNQSQSVFMDNAIEVPNKSGVKVQNACIVEIAGAGGALVGINSIVNGTGQGISTGVGGKGYAREYIINYENGTATLKNSTQTGIQSASETHPIPATITPVPGGTTTSTNVALNKTATSNHSGNGAANLGIDGNPGTRFESEHSASNYELVYSIDLGQVYSIDRIKIDWEHVITTASRFKIEIASSANGPWTTVCSQTSGNPVQYFDQSFSATNGRYVKLTATEKTGIYGYSFWEFEVYGR